MGSEPLGASLPEGMSVGVGQSSDEPQTWPKDAARWGLGPKAGHRVGGSASSLRMKIILRKCVPRFQIGKHQRHSEAPTRTEFIVDPLRALYRSSGRHGGRVLLNFLQRFEECLRSKKKLILIHTEATPFHTKTTLMKRGFKQVSMLKKNTPAFAAPDDQRGLKWWFEKIIKKHNASYFKDYRLMKSKCVVLGMPNKHTFSTSGLKHYCLNTSEGT